MDKAVIIKTEKDPHGGKTHVVLYTYAISPRVRSQDGVDVVVQTRGMLPAEAAKVVARKDTLGTWRNALDAGDAGFEVLNRYQTANEGIAAFASRALADHTARQTWWVQSQRDRYADQGRGTSG